MFEEGYKEMCERISPDRQLIDGTISLIRSRAAGRKSARPFYRRPLAAAALILVCILTAVPALAAGMPAVRALMYMVSPEAAQFFAPVQKSCEDNGIRMEVASAYIHGDTAQAYITLRDLTGDRVDETTDLNDSYSLRLPFDSSANCELIGYDPGTKTAAFLITITGWGKKNIEGDKLTFSVRNFMSRKREYEDIPIGIDLGSLSSAQTKESELTGWGGSLSPGGEKAHSSERVIVPSGSVISPVEGIDITGAGYVGDELHLQFAVKDLLKNDNHGYFYLKDKTGGKIMCDYSVAFTEYSEPGNEDTRLDYREFVFDIPRGGIKDYALCGSFYTSGLYTEGDWSVTFPLTSDGNG